MRRPVPTASVLARRRAWLLRAAACVAAVAGLVLAGCGGTSSSGGGSRSGPGPSPTTSGHGSHAFHGDAVAHLAGLLGQASGGSAANSGPGLRLATFSLAAPTIEVTPSSSTSLQQALDKAPAGAVIHVASGHYPGVVDLRQHASWVTVTGAGDPTLPVIDGAKLYGATNVRFVGIRFTNTVAIEASPTLHYAQRAANIAILDSEVDCGSTTTTPATIGIGVREAAQNITISGDYVHNCVVGFGTGASDKLSTNIAITGCLFEHFPGDAMDLGAIRGIEIDHDVIRDMQSAVEASYHNDGIQIVGSVSDATITNNVIANSGGQLMLIQDTIPNPYVQDANNHDLLIAHNLIYGSNGFAIQDEGALGVRFVGNTIWSALYAGLLLRQGAGAVVPKDTVVVDNIIQGFGTTDGASTKVEDYNLITNTPSSYTGGPHDIRTVQPPFVDPGAGIFSLRSDPQPLSGAAASAAAGYVAGVAALRRDAYGRSAQWAAPGAIQPGDPAVPYGVPRFRPQARPRG